MASPPGGGTEGGDSIEARVTALETELKHLATKTDVQALKTWVLGGVIGGVIGGIILAVFVTLAVARIFFPASG